jgi:hypothetical protein
MPCDNDDDDDDDHDDDDCTFEGHGMMLALNYIQC